MDLLNAASVKIRRTYRRPAAEQAVQSSSLVSTPRPARRVLLAEDDTEMRELVAHALRSSHYEVVECRNGVELLGRIDPEAPADEIYRFDLIISDIRMPGVTGLSLLEGLQQWAELRPLQMILITAFGDEQIHARAQELGAVAVLDKPFEMQELLVKVQEVFDRRAASSGGGDSMGQTRVGQEDERGENEV
jgi:CheY-like chemotaxis protein